MERRLAAVLAADVVGYSRLLEHDKDPYGHYIVVWPSLLQWEHESAVAEAQRAIDLTPNFALGYLRPPRAIHR